MKFTQKVPVDATGNKLFNLEIKWIEWGFSPLLCTYRLNRTRRNSWGSWEEWDDTALQTQDSKFELWRSETVHATSQSWRFPTIMNPIIQFGRRMFFTIQILNQHWFNVSCSGDIPTNISHSPNAVSILTPRLRCWPKFEPAAMDAGNPKYICKFRAKRGSTNSTWSHTNPKYVNLGQIRVK